MSITLEDDQKICITCEKPKNRTRGFYISYNKFHNGRMPVCKDCLHIKDEENLKEVKEVLMILGKPLYTELWEKAKDHQRETLGIYLKNLNLNKTKYDTYEDSDHIQNKDVNYNTSNTNNDNQISDELIEKWGLGYTPQEYKAFERKYNTLKNNYQEKTSMHTEALLTYIRYKVKAELAVAQDESKSAKTWGDLASQAAKDAKINPSQLSKADLSDGLDTFGQLVRTVEQHEDIIPILPQFKERPHDKPDFTMFCYINYIRDLKGLPLAQYEDVYQFYEDRKSEYANDFDFLQNEGES